MKKKLFIFLLILLLPMLMGASYNYSFYGDVVYSVPGMTFSSYFNEQTLGVSFSKPEYLVVYEDKIYVIDSGSSSLYVINSDFTMNEEPLNKFKLHPERESDEFLKGETVDIEGEKFIVLKNPEGIEVAFGNIYIADTANRRVLKMTLDYKVIDIFKDPKDPVFKDMVAYTAQEERRKAHEEAQKDLPDSEKKPFDEDDVPGVLFLPSKITVDDNERMYIIAKNVFEGIVELSPDGEFNRFTGVNPLKLSPAEIFRRSLMSESQKKKLRTFLPTTFTSVRMGDGNFIYATAKESSNNNKNMIQLINPKGIDVIKKNGYHIPMGDIQFPANRNLHGVKTGSSELVDVDYTSGGIYSVLDKKRSRIFTYDVEGNLLYITGSEGNQSDKFSTGVSLGYLNNQIIVLDQYSKTFVVYKPSNFGELVNEAVRLEYEGDYEASKVVWEEIVRLNVNYEIAYGGIGRYHLRKGNFKEAVEYFKLGHFNYYYSKAYQNYRNEILRKNFGWIFLGGVLIISAFIGKAVYKKYKGGTRDEE